MTDEEKFMEEWTVTQEEAESEIYANEKHCKKCINFAECVESAIEDRCKTYRESYKDYLNGLTEGRKEKWHEIKCCSQDLPPRSKDNHLHSVIVSNEYGEPIYYDYNIDEWCDMEGDVVSEGYKYWCELPKFEE